MTMENAESRAARRLKVLKAGKIIYNFSQSIVDCTVRDLSETGAKLICPGNHLLPNDIKLIFMQDNTIRDANIVWRKGDLIGVHFTSPATRAPPRKYAPTEKP